VNIKTVLEFGKEFETVEGMFVILINNKTRLAVAMDNKNSHGFSIVGFSHQLARVK
jgi:hypothetical protein